MKGRLQIKTPLYWEIEELLGFIDEPNKSRCTQILNENRELFEQAHGSAHKHQAWEGGYIDHITECMNYAHTIYIILIANLVDQ